MKQQVPFQSDNLSEGDCVSFMLSSASSGMISATSISKCDPSSLSATVDIACANIGEYIAEKRVIMLSADFELGYAIIFIIIPIMTALVIVSVLLL